MLVKTDLQHSTLDLALTSTEYTKSVDRRYYQDVPPFPTLSYHHVILPSFVDISSSSSSSSTNGQQLQQLHSTSLISTQSTLNGLVTFAYIPPGAF